MKVVGEIPSGLPPLSWPAVPWDQLGTLLEAALVVVFVGYLESIAIAKALAGRRRRKVDAVAFSAPIRIMGACYRRPSQEGITRWRRNNDRKLWKAGNGPIPFPAQRRTMLNGGSGWA